MTLNQIGILIIVIYQQRKKTITKKRVEQEIFILQKKLDETYAQYGFNYNFWPSTFGPHSPEVYENIEFLAKVGIVKDTEHHHEASVSLTTKGKKFYNEKLTTNFWELTKTHKFNEKIDGDPTFYTLMHYPEYSTFFSTRSDVYGKKHKKKRYYPVIKIDDKKKYYCHQLKKYSFVLKNIILNKRKRFCC